MGGDYAKLREALRVIVCRYLRNHAAALPPVQQWVVFNAIEGGFNTRTEYRRTYNVRITEQELARSDIEAVAATFHHDDALLREIFGQIADSPLPDSDGRRSLVFHRVVAPFLKDYLLRANRSTFVAEAFDASFSVLVSDLSRTEVAATLVAPLHNLTLAIPTFDLAPRIRIRQLPWAEFERWYNSGDIAFAGASYGPLDMQCVLEVTYTRGRATHGDDPFTAPEWVATRQRDLAIRALQLVTGANVQFCFSIERTDGILWKHQGGSIGRRHERVIPGKAEAAILDQAAKLIPKLDLPPFGERHALALQRWESGLARETLEDRLIDHWIGLEALFTSGSQGEISYRAALRIAAFVGRTAPERVALYDAAKSSYTWRSKTVHGTAQSGKTIEAIDKAHRGLFTASKAASDMLSAALVRIAIKGKMIDDAAIEKELLRASAPEKETPFE